MAATACGPAANPACLRPQQTLTRCLFLARSRWGGWLPLPASKCQSVVPINDHEQNELSTQDISNLAQMPTLKNNSGNF